MWSKPIASLLVLITIIVLGSACTGDASGPAAPVSPREQDNESIGPASPDDSTPSPRGEISGGGEEALPPLSSEPVQLALSVMTSNRFLELAVQQFEARHPNIAIEINEYVAAPAVSMEGGSASIAVGDPEPKDVEKFVHSLNTELMSGRASDLIVTNKHVSYRYYADKRFLAELGGWMDADSAFERSDYYANMLDALTDADGLHALPISLSMHMMVGNRALLGDAAIDDRTWTWDEFEQLAFRLKGDSDTYALTGVDGAALLALMVNTGYDELVDAEARTFDAEAFADMLRRSKAMLDAGAVTGDETARANALFRSFRPAGYEDMVLMGQMTFDGGELYHMPAAASGRSASFISDFLISVNAKSPHAREAWEFVKYLLSEEMQGTPELPGLSVNRKASRKQQEQLLRIDADTYKGLGLVFDGKRFVPTTPTQADIDAIERRMTDIAHFAYTDPKVLAIIEAESAAFFTGRRTVDATAEAVARKVGTYLNE